MQLKTPHKNITGKNPRINKDFHPFFGFRRGLFRCVRRFAVVAFPHYWMRLCGEKKQKFYFTLINPNFV
jgi:hypothetical protein